MTADGTPDISGLAEGLSGSLNTPEPPTLRKALAQRSATRRKRIGVGVVAATLVVGGWFVNAIGDDSAIETVAEGEVAESTTAPPALESTIADDSRSGELSMRELIQSEPLWAVVDASVVAGTAVSLQDDVFAITNGCDTRSFEVTWQEQNFILDEFAGVQLDGESQFGDICGFATMTSPLPNSRRGQLVTVRHDGSTIVLSVKGPKGWEIHLDDWEGSLVVTPLFGGGGPTVTPDATELVEVPDVVGLFADQATQLLREDGYTVQIDFADSDTPPNAVISQQPSAGALVEPGSTIGLIVALE